MSTRPLGMEGASGARHALRDDLSMCVDQNAHAISIVIPAKAGTQNLKQGLIQIIPIWIRLFNHAYFPKAFPFLHLLFAGDRLPNVVKLLKPYQNLAAIFSRKPVSRAFLMLPNSQR